MIDLRLGQRFAAIEAVGLVECVLPRRRELRHHRRGWTAAGRIAPVGRQRADWKCLAGHGVALAIDTDAGGRGVETALRSEHQIAETAIEPLGIVLIEKPVEAGQRQFDLLIGKIDRLGARAEIREHALQVGMRVLPRQQRRVGARRLDGERAVVGAHQPEHVADGERAQVHLGHVLEDEPGHGGVLVEEASPEVRIGVARGLQIDGLSADVEPEFHALQRGWPLNPFSECLEGLFVGGLRRQSRRRDNRDPQPASVVAVLEPAVRKHGPDDSLLGHRAFS